MSSPEPRTWIFKFINYRVGVGDSRTESPIPPEFAHISGLPAPFKNNRIDFTVGGRAWTLTDDLMGEECHQNQSKVKESLLSGTLSTPFVDGDTWEVVGQVADDTARLLSFALCTWVSWARCSQISDSGATTFRYDRDAHAHLAYSSIKPQIEQLEVGVIKRYLEETYPRFVADRDVLDHAIGVYVESRVSDSLIVRTALLNMLLDSLQDQVHAKGHAAQIDEKLPERLDNPEFQTKFHALLSTLSGKWTAQRTKDLTGTIKGWNTKPGFGKAARDAFESLGIKGFETLKLGARHLLLHKAVLKLKDEEKLPYLFELDYLVFLMIARLLGYSGLFVHQHTGPEPKRLADVVSVIDDPGGPDVGTQIDAL